MKNGKLCLCVDYIGLNAVCVENVYPLPPMDMLVYLAKVKIFTKLDLREAYYHVRIREGNEWETVFNCPLGCFQSSLLTSRVSGHGSVHAIDK